MTCLESRHQQSHSPRPLPLFATGLAGLGWFSRRRRKRNQGSTGLDQAEWSGATATGYIYYLNISSAGSWGFHGEASDPLKIDYPPWLALAPVPLPTTLPLFASGLAGLGWLARRKKRA